MRLREIIAKAEAGADKLEKEIRKKEGLEIKARYQLTPGLKKEVKGSLWLAKEIVRLDFEKEKVLAKMLNSRKRFWRSFKKIHGEGDFMLERKTLTIIELCPKTPKPKKGISAPPAAKGSAKGA